jgi:cbb3-type cytochrome oxidase maturation protein
MEVLFLLVPMSAVLVFVILGVFANALAGGQFDNLEVEGERILAEATPAEPAPADTTLTRGHEPEQATRD